MRWTPRSDEATAPPGNRKTHHIVNAIPGTVQLALSDPTVRQRALVPGVVWIRLTPVIRPVL
jgi:hypothetical protein